MFDKSGAPIKLGDYVKSNLHLTTAWQFEAKYFKVVLNSIGEVVLYNEFFDYHSPIPEAHHFTLVHRRNNN